MPPKRQERSKLPIPLPEGWILNDTNKKSWRLAVPCDATIGEALHVIKVEYQQNGPLFCELKFYQRAAKQKNITDWMISHRLDYLGIPRYWGSGDTMFNSRCYRFMVMERLGVDLQKILRSNKNKLPVMAVLQLGIRLLDILEYIHEHEYVHGDVKAANVMLGCTDPNKVYLADYGLSYRYCSEGNHKQYEENPKKGPNGTIEFTSLDAHKGVAPSRRGDLQILAYCMLQWLCGKLPWDQNLENPTAVLNSKTKLLDELPDSVIEWTAQENGCHEIAKFMAGVYCLEYDEKPNYEVLKEILLNGLESSGACRNAPLNFSAAGNALQRPAAANLKIHSRKVNAKQICVGEIKNVNDIKNCNHGKPNQLQKKLQVDLCPKQLCIQPTIHSRKINAKQISVGENKNVNDIKNCIHGKHKQLQKQLQVDLYPEQLCIQPMGRANRKVIPKYNVPTDSEVARFENSVQNHQTVLQGNATSSGQLEYYHQDQENIYKYCLAIPILLIMIFLSLSYL
ncbi:serine/threonine-protein kinase VRK2 isoform X2 [Ascaphus truei]|uniref:serine/threonine-protein kinase VRK2 isoform X2 n=1 Tax=Ascaphus truei TaxID=8439 RepID=UPI003F5A72B1